MVDRRHELDLGKLERVFRWELYVDPKKSTLEWRIFWSLDREFPMHHRSDLLDFVVAILISILTLLSCRQPKTPSTISSFL